ncbi:hypothetical protein PsAD46_02649 [Pseudovibrio sp. Ad46]|nr:hypothetical protein PsAD46_02649 [Pseudovibrio sp. Ad46]
MAFIATGNLGDHSGEMAQALVFMMDGQCGGRIQQAMQIQRIVGAGKLNLDLREAIKALCCREPGDQQFRVGLRRSCKGKGQILFLEELWDLDNSIHNKLTGKGKNKGSIRIKSDLAD